MTQRLATLRATAPLALLLGALGLLAAAESGAAANPGRAAKPAAEKTSDAAPRKKYTTETVRGRVVWLEDALAGEFGVTTEPSAGREDGGAGNGRRAGCGRSFPTCAAGPSRWTSGCETWIWNCWCAAIANAPMIQVIRVFRPNDEGLFEVDYWCDICAIPMYILKPCECCQGQTRLRERPAEDSRDGG